MRSRQAALAVLGLYVCLVASIVHRHTYVVGSIELPWGLLLGLVAAWSTTRAVRRWVRSGDLFFALGWTIGLTLPMFSPGGSYLIASDTLGISFLLGGLLALALAMIRVPRAD